jgi:methionine S-methyltransferase
MNYQTQNKVIDFSLLSLTNLSNIIPTRVLKKHLNADGRVNFELISCVFKPDQWTKAFLRGLYNFGETGGFTDKTVVELGSGCAINSILVNNIYSPKFIYGSDIHPDVYENAVKNISLTLPEDKRKNIEIVPGAHNLDSWMKDDFKVDVIFGCLPQVIAPTEIANNNFTGENNEASSHYYIPSEYPLARETSHALGLALNEHALRKLKTRLTSSGKVILNLGGRAGKESLLEMFTASGYTPEVLHEEFIEQHSGTSIETFVDVENISSSERTFEFFNEFGQQISALQADLNRKAGKKIYHKIYVIAGTVADNV